jgi:hypothetical protein
MEATTSRGRSVTIALMWLIMAIAVVGAAWALTHLGGHAGVPGVADPTPTSTGGGLPWG